MSKKTKEYDSVPYIGKKRGRKPKQLLESDIVTKRGRKNDEDDMININDIQEDHLFMQDIESNNLTEKDKTLIKKNNMIKERLITIDKILEMYPSLKKDRMIIVNNILNKREQKIDDFVLERVKIDNINYYFDPDGNIIDENVNLVGFFVKNKDKYGYCLFSDNVKRMIALENNIEKVKKMSNDLIVS